MAKEIPIVLNDKAASVIQSIFDKQAARFREMMREFICAHLRLEVKRIRLDGADSIHVYLMWDAHVICDSMFLMHSL